MELEERIARAARAQEVIENEIYQESFEIVKQEILNTWENSPSRDSSGRETLFLMVKMLDKLKLTLNSVMETGTLAKLELKHQETILDKAKRTIQDW